MTRVHALVVALFLLTVVAHATLAGFLRLVSRLPRSKADTSSLPLGVAPADPITDRSLDVDRPMRSNRPHNVRRRVVIYGTCAGCGMPISMTHSTRRGLRS